MNARLPSRFSHKAFAAIFSLLNGAAAVQAQSWNLAGNAGTNPSANFLGTTDREPLIVQPGPGNVGIGTTSPGTKLHVLGPGGGGVVATFEQPTRAMNFVDLKSSQGGGNYGTDLRFIDSGTVNVEIKSTANGQLRFATSGTERVLIDSSGNVGIGSLSPGATLHVSTGRDFNTPQAEITQTTAQDFARLRFASFGIDPDNPSHPRPYPLWDIAVGKGVLNLFAQASGNVMTLTSNGKIGIRTERPATELDVNGTATVKVLQVTGGADLSEHFEVRGATGVETAASSLSQAGLVVSIDPDEPGKLVISSQAYDHKVAGVISGAGGVRPGMLMSQSGSMTDGDHPVALTGRVYCWADAAYGPIAPGDLLTTSDTPGHAMKVTDYANARGAVLGKAMAGLKQGKGLVLVLVTLQ